MDGWADGKKKAFHSKELPQKMRQTAGEWGLLLFLIKKCAASL